MQKSKNIFWPQTIISFTLPLEFLVLLGTSDLNINCCHLLIMKRFLEAVLLLSTYFAISRILLGINKWVNFYKGQLHIGSRFTHFLPYFLDKPLHFCPAKCDIVIRRSEKGKIFKNIHAERPKWSWFFQNKVSSNTLYEIENENHYCQN